MLSILDDLKQALNAHDFAKAAMHLDENGVITYYNAEVTQGHEQGQAYFDRMLKDSAAVVKEYSLTGDISAPAVFHGSTAVAYGTTEEHFKLAEGLEFVLHGRWTTTLQKKDGSWKIIALHFSSNLFDNPLLNNAKRLTWILAAVAFFAGLLVMFIFTRFARKR
ncbi:MAG: nuclear transport factor 2 family protein [Gammaproteobacteria bacterium]|nr:nuclear transport factor 2 family protein [Gammaproteobacteria bacterium]